jgi:predicted small lipoprotein YifL
MCSKHDRKRLLNVFLVLLALLLALPSCGEDEPVANKMPFPGADQQAEGAPEALKDKVKRKKRRAGEVDTKEFAAKAEWDMLRPHFEKFGATMEEEIHSQSVTWKYKDAFADRTEKFYPPEVAPKGPMLDLAKAKSGVSPEKKKEAMTIESILAGIVPPGSEGLEDVASEITDLGSKGPLELHPLDDYLFRIIMTGVSNPEALVEAPDGISHVVRENDKIGSEGGHVVEIFKHKVFVQVPDQPVPFEVSLAPTSLPGNFASQ